jgi:hypothetical protein
MEILFFGRALGTIGVVAELSIFRLSVLLVWVNPMKPLSSPNLPLVIRY